MGDRNEFDTRHRPLTPSKAKLQDERILSADAAPDDLPTDEQVGWDVTDYPAILMTCHPTAPDLETVAADTATIRPWWYRKEANAGTREPKGQWFAGREYVVALNGDSAIGGPMQRRFSCKTAERMFFQVLDITDVGGVDQSVAIGVYYLDKRDDEDGVSDEVNVNVEIGEIDIANLFDTLAHEDYIYSNRRGDFLVERSSATTLTLSNLTIPVDAIDIVAVGKKEAGSSEWVTQWRDHNLELSWAPATGIITLASMSVGATDEVRVYIEGPSKTLDLENHARRATQTNPDSQRVATDGHVELVVGAAATHDVFFNMAEDGYHFLTLHCVITGSSQVALWATNDEEPEDADAVWVDITEEVFGETVLTLVTNAVQIPNSSINFRRCRWRITDTGDGGTVDLYYLKSAYGAPHVRLDDLVAALAEHDLPVLDIGIHPMLESQQFDGAVFPNFVSADGEAVRHVGSRYGVAYSMLTGQDGSETPIIPHDTKIDDGASATTGQGANVVMVGGEAKRFDGSPLPNTVGEQDATRLAYSQSGVAFMMPVINSGASTPLGIHDSAVGGADGIGVAPMIAGAEANEAQQTAVDDGDATRLAANLYGELIAAGYVWANQALRTEEDDPLDQRFVPDLLVDDAAITAGDDWYFDMDGYRFFNLHLGMTDTGGEDYTVRVWATNRNDGTAPASIPAVDWEDVTTAWFGAATFTATSAISHMLERDTPCAVKYVWVETTAVTGTPTASIMLKRLW